MTKTIRKLEKESNMWRTRYENTNVSLIQMVEEVTIASLFSRYLDCPNWLKSLSEIAVWGSR